MGTTPHPSLDIEPLHAALTAAIARLFDASVVAHDVQHLHRVARLADTICVAEGGNRTVVAAAAFLHDQHRLLEKQRGRHVQPEEAEPEAREILRRIGAIGEELHADIFAAINFTERYRCAGDDLAALNPSVEARTVRDADMLDALGAVGIARAFMFGGYLGEPLWMPHDPTAPAQTFRHGKTASVVHHFHEKLLRLEAEMLTRRGRDIARERTVFMREFLARLMHEID